MNSGSSDRWSRRGFVAGLTGLGIAAATIPGSAAELSTPGYQAVPVPLADVNVNDHLWSPAIERARSVALPNLLSRPRSFADGRLIEAASYFLAKKPDPALRRQVEEMLDRSIANLRSREHTWPNRGDGSTLSAGTFFEAAVAYHEATGSRKLLDAATRAADDLDATFGPGKRYDIASHEGVEMGLVKLYRATDNERYLKLAKFLVDTRGTRSGGRELFGPYAQDDVPVKEQTRAIGHCVRATYLYNAVTDLAGYARDAGYALAIQRIWEDAAAKRTYVTGGIGTYRHEENFGDDYDLPNLGCWNEICAAVGSTLWNHRLFLLTADSKYIDMMERVLYNALLTGMSLDGETFLYQAPLKTLRAFARQPYFGPNCCPPNLTRLLAQFGRLIYARQDRDVFVNLFVESDAGTRVGDTPVAIVQETRYPWEGKVRLTVNPASPVRFRLLVRVPGWARNEPMPGGLYRYLDADPGAAQVAVNGRPISVAPQRGYAAIEREWAKGDIVEVDLPMPVRRVGADARAADDRGMAALERGPVVFCAEGIDNGDSVFDLVLPDDARLQFAERREILGGIGTIEGKIARARRAAGGTRPAQQEHALRAIPYFAFANRRGTEMAVWLARDERRAVIAPMPTIAATSRAASSCGNGTVTDDYPGHKPPTVAQRLFPSAQDGSGDIGAICDQIEPVNSEDGSNPYLRLRPQSGDQAWVQYEFAAPSKVSSVDVYWKDDKQYCVLPKGWRLLYKDGAAWKPVRTAMEYGVSRNQYNHVAFDAVTTPALRMEIQLRPTVYKKGALGPPDANWMAEDVTWYEGGVIEWRVNS